MATIVKCDVCGKEISKEKPIIVNDSEVLGITLVYKTPYGEIRASNNSSDMRDLCHNCFNILDGWINKKGKLI